MSSTRWYGGAQVDHQLSRVDVLGDIGVRHGRSNH